MSLVDFTINSIALNFKLSYRFGNSSTEQYLGQQNGLDRSRVQVYRKWTKVRRQLELLRILVLPQQSETE